MPTIKNLSTAEPYEEMCDLVRSALTFAYAISQIMIWDAYHQESHTMPNRLDLARQLANFNHFADDDVDQNVIHIWTARPEKFREISEDWLMLHGNSI